MSPWSTTSPTDHRMEQSDGTDYTAVTGTLTITAGATSGEIEVPVILDSTDEVDETATLPCHQLLAPPLTAIPPPQIL